ncbi:hypothetical protein TEQG_07124 [Trichophyton equinum CBS 127.97]|uniref:Uncharacterized protein n=1 Tax=Trichophyton equinum (strain ATCC MYA-4606 / CBS 127.97) TaxID=559882 RepID=F2Q1P0_TRIEC|nr:hypothetical protein TEQG_07124 [Trichophyton equinum CBS 127.97]
MTYDQELQLYELTVICQLYPAGCPRSRNPARPWRSAVWILTQRQIVTGALGIYAGARQQQADKIKWFARQTETKALMTHMRQSNNQKNAEQHAEDNVVSIGRSERLKKQRHLRPQNSFQNIKPKLSMFFLPKLRRAEKHVGVAENASASVIGLHPLGAWANGFKLDLPLDSHMTLLNSIYGSMVRTDHCPPISASSARLQPVKADHT